MSAKADLSGKRVLVVEDDYFLAVDAQRALQSVGAEVVGPFPHEADAMTAIEADGLRAALVDINLGEGPAFNTAKALRAAGVPFIFLTGYDQGVIPAEFADVPRFEKPVELSKVIHAVAEMTA